MKTPIYDFARQYAQNNPLRLHMPGHKGESRLGVEALDITEIPGADVLYHSQGILKESQENAAALFGTGKTLYSTEGSSLSIRAMLYLTKLYGGKDCRILAGRNAHKVFLTASALLDIPVTWLYPKAGSLLSCPITPKELEHALAQMPQAPTAVYLTSPDYLGAMADIPALAAVAHRYGCLLLVDNAHGAYLKFLPEDQHPITLGADLCCDSAHKTLPVLTGGGYLHISKSAPALMAENAERAMAIFASTSPSYLILESLDLANAYLTEALPEKLRQALPVWDTLKRELQEAGFPLGGGEPLKLTLLPKTVGYTGTELAEILEAQGIFPEFSDPDHLVCMLSVENSQADAQRLRAALLSLPRKAPVREAPPVLTPAPCETSPAEVLYLPTRKIPVTESLGCVLADPCVSCPPAVPIAMLGEVLTENALNAMIYYGIETVTVVK